MFFFVTACNQAQEINLERGRKKETPPCSSDEVGNYTRNEPSFFWGAKVFVLAEQYQSITTAQHLIDLKMNTASLMFPIPYDEDGTVRYPFSIFDLTFQSLDDHLCQMGNLVHEMKSAGLSVYISAEPHYFDREGWARENGMDEDLPTPMDFGPITTQNLMEELLPVMEQLSDLSEKYHVELFAPISEPDNYFGADNANLFMDQARLQFAGFEGKLVWQVYGDLIREPDDPDRGKTLHFDQYDVVGLSLMGCDDYLFAWDNYIDQIVEWANNDQVPEIMIAEMGCTRPPQSVETAVSNYNYWVELTEDYSEGIILLDSPSFDGEYGILGGWQEDWVAEISDLYFD
ncbi:MAG: hypothetical protein CMK59_04130 [Proteobacteria bacterium]|nr:hypothetical protein [Pseudomonadota bacterium]